MLVVMRAAATPAEIDTVVRRIGELGLTAIPLPGAENFAALMAMLPAVAGAVGRPAAMGVAARS